MFYTSEIMCFILQKSCVLYLYESKQNEIFHGLFLVINLKTKQKSCLFINNSLNTLLSIHNIGFIGNTVFVQL